MPKPIRPLTIIAAGLVLTALGTPGLPAAEPPLLNGEPMRGTWGFSASGTILPPALPVATPAVAVGLMTFDPTTRNCILQDTVNIGGASCSRTSETCTYGLGSTDDPVVVPLSFVLVDKEREMRFIRTDLGVAEGGAKLQ